MFLAFAIMGWSFILLGSLFQIFIAVISFVDTAYELPSFLNNFNLFSKKTVLDQPYLSAKYGETYMTYLIPTLLLLVALSVFAVGVYELMRMKKGQLLTKPYVKIYFIALIIASLVYGRVEGLVLAGCLFIGLILLETALFSSEGLKNYVEEREMIVINHEEKRFEKEVSKPGKHARSVEKNQETVNEDKTNSKISASINENDKVETVATFNYPKTILASSEKVNNYDVFQNENNDFDDKKQYVELGVSNFSNDPYAELAEDEEVNDDYGVNMFGQTSLTSEKLNYTNETANKDESYSVSESAFLEKQEFIEDEATTDVIKTDENNIESEENNLSVGEDIDFGFDEIDDINLQKQSVESVYTIAQDEPIEVSNYDQLIDKKPYKKWTILQSNIMLKLEQINDLDLQEEQKSQAKLLRKLQKAYNKKVKKANLLASKLNLQEEDYFKYIEITAAKSTDSNIEQNFEQQEMEQFDLKVAADQIEQTSDSEETFNFDLLEIDQVTDMENDIDTMIIDQMVEQTDTDLKLDDKNIEVEELAMQPSVEIDSEEELNEQKFEEQEVIIPTIKVENSNLFKFQDRETDEGYLSSDDVFDNIEKINEEELLIKDQQIADQEQLIKAALNDEKWEQRFDLFDNRLTKLEKIMIDSSFQKIEKDKNFEKLHLDLNQIQSNLKKITGDVVGLEEKTQQISKVISDERSAINFSKPTHTIEQHYPKIDDFNFNLSKYSLYNRSGYSNTYGTVVTQDTANKYSGPRRVSEYNKIKAKGYNIDYANNENIEKTDYGHVSLHNISKYTKETVPFAENCSLCKKIKD